jgi:hypothetical protein
VLRNWAFACCGLLKNSSGISPHVFTARERIAVRRRVVITGRGTVAYRDWHRGNPARIARGAAGLTWALFGTSVLPRQRQVGWSAISITAVEHPAVPIAPQTVSAMRQLESIESMYAVSFLSRIGVQSLSRVIGRARGIAQQVGHTIRSSVFMIRAAARFAMPSAPKPRADAAPGPTDLCSGRSWPYRNGCPTHCVRATEGCSKMPPSAIIGSSASRMGGGYDVGQIHPPEGRRTPCETPSCTGSCWASSRRGR